MPSQELIPNLFRTEYSKLVAVLCKVFGLSNIQLAEDIVSDTFLQAAENWEQKGIPENPVAWLYTVAKNKTRDFLRREKLRREKIEPNIKYEQEDSYSLELDFSQQNIEDSQLRMLFAVAHPLLKKPAQIALALRVLCGFANDEIATALLTNKEVVNKRLYRAKQCLREHEVKIDFPPEKEISARLDTVLTTLYLLFNEGYHSLCNDKALRKDLCLEAMRLTILLVRNQATNLPKVNALLALMCFHASRFEARQDKEGALVLYEEQDRSLWDQALIEKGEYYLNRSAGGKEVNRYHFEAAIAYWHTQEDSPAKWESVLQLYNNLLQMQYSVVAALNRTYALAQANGKKPALEAALKLDLDKSHLYHLLLAELYKGSELDKQKHHLKIALDLSKSPAEKDLIRRKLERL